MRAVGVKGDVVHAALMAGEGADGFAVSKIPKLDESVVAAGGDEFAVGADGDSLDPAMMGIDGAGWLFALNGPPQQPAIVTASEQRLAVLRKTNGAHPGVSALELHLVAGRRFPAPHVIILRTGKDKAAFRLVPAGN